MQKANNKQTMLLMKNQKAILKMPNIPKPNYKMHTTLLHNVKRHTNLKLMYPKYPTYLKQLSKPMNHKPTFPKLPLNMNLKPTLPKLPPNTNLKPTFPKLLPKLMNPKLTLLSRQQKPMNHKDIWQNKYTQHPLLKLLTQPWLSPFTQLL